MRPPVWVQSSAPPAEERRRHDQHRTAAPPRAHARRAAPEIAETDEAAFTTERGRDVTAIVSVDASITGERA